MKSTFSNWYRNQMFGDEETARKTEQARSILKSTKSIAIVGLSRDKNKESQFVGRYLQSAGYTIYPVHPSAEKLLDKLVYKKLEDINDQIDVVDVFLPQKIIPNFIQEAIDVAPRGIWLQLGTGKQQEAVESAGKAGIPIFENRCIKVDHQFLIRDQLEKEK